MICGNEDDNEADEGTGAERWWGAGGAGGTKRAGTHRATGAVGGASSNNLCRESAESCWMAMGIVGTAGVGMPAGMGGEVGLSLLLTLPGGLWASKKWFLNSEEKKKHWKLCRDDIVRLEIGLVYRL